MLNNYSVYLSRNKTSSRCISKTLEKYLSAKFTVVRPNFLIGIDINGSYTIRFQDSRLIFTFNSKVTSSDIATFDDIIQNVIADFNHTAGYVIHKNFQFLDEKILVN